MRDYEARTVRLYIVYCLRCCTHLLGEILQVEPLDCWLILQVEPLDCCLILQVEPLDCWLILQVEPLDCWLILQVEPLECWLILQVEPLDCCITIQHLYWLPSEKLLSSCRNVRPSRTVRDSVRTDKHKTEIAISNLVPLLFCEENEMRQTSSDSLLCSLHKIAHLGRRLKTVETELMV